jgi:hypothetical protein
MMALIDSIFFLWFDIIPDFVINLSVPISLILIGFIVEKNFVSRPALFSNAIALNMYLINKTSLASHTTIYADISLLVGLIAILSRTFEFSLPSKFYTFCWFYSSITVGAYILFYEVFGEPVTVILSAFGL